MRRRRLSGAGLHSDALASLFLSLHGISIGFLCLRWLGSRLPDVTSPPGPPNLCRKAAPDVIGFPGTDVRAEGPNHGMLGRNRDGPRHRELRRLQELARFRCHACRQERDVREPQPRVVEIASPACWLDSAGTIISMMNKLERSHP
jgi:hypothetical protein